MESNNQANQKPTLLQVIYSVLAAAFGVQTSANRERDFSQGSATIYIVAAFLFTIFFVWTLIQIVQWVIH